MTSQRGKQTFAMDNIVQYLMKESQTDNEAWSIEGI